MKILSPVLAMLMSASSLAFAAGGPGSAFDPNVFGLGGGALVLTPPPVGAVIVFGAAPGGRRQRDFRVRVKIAAIDAEGDEVVVENELSRELGEDDETFFPLGIRYCRRKWPTTKCFEDDRRLVVSLKSCSRLVCGMGENYWLKLDVPGPGSPIFKGHFVLGRGFGKKSVTTTGQFRYSGWGIYPASMRVDYGLSLELEEVE